MSSHPEGKSLVTSCFNLSTSGCSERPWCAACLQLTLDGALLATARPNPYHSFVVLYFKSNDHIPTVTPPI